jgi:hypothetical protein
MSYYSYSVIDICEPRTIALTSNVKYSLEPNEVYYILESSDSDSDNDSIPEEKVREHCSRCTMRD